MKPLARAALYLWGVALASAQPARAHVALLALAYLPAFVNAWSLDRLDHEEMWRNEESRLDHEERQLTHQGATNANCDNTCRNAGSFQNCICRSYYPACRFDSVANKGKCYNNYAFQSREPDGHACGGFRNDWDYNTNCGNPYCGPGTWRDGNGENAGCVKCEKGKYSTSGENQVSEGVCIEASKGHIVNAVGLTEQQGEQPGSDCPSRMARVALPT